MDFITYQKKAIDTAIYPYKGDNLVYPALKLNGEAGEVAELVGKWIRDRGYWPGLNNKPNGFMADVLIDELGDVLWYIAALATELEIDLEYVAENNLKKLTDRQNRGKIHGSGDRR